MFGKLFLRECNMAMRSITYLAFIVALMAMFFTQYLVEVNYDLTQAQKGIAAEEPRWGGSDDSLFLEPLPYTENYGMIDAEIPEQVMPNVAYRMFRDILNNRYDTYMLGLFLTHKNLNGEEQARVLEIFKEITGQSLTEVQNTFYKMDLAEVIKQYDVTEDEAKIYLEDVYYKQLAYEFVPNNSTSLLFHYEEYIPVNSRLSYEQFKELIKEFRGIIGGKTVAYENLSEYGAVPLTYENALTRYDEFVNEDMVSGAYARLFCDYAGIVVGIVPAFIAVGIAMADIRRKTHEMISVSAEQAECRNMIARFSAIVMICFIPIVLLGIAASYGLSRGVEPFGLTVNGLAFIKYSVVWLLPTLMFAIAIGLFFTELTGKPVGILVQLVIWIWSTWIWTENGLAATKYGFNMFIRHNVVGEYQTYVKSLSEIMINRAVYAMIAIGLIVISWRLQKNREASRVYKRN